MKTVRSFANEEEEAEVFGRRLQQVYWLNRKEAAAYTSYVWGSGVRAGAQSRGPLSRLVAECSLHTVRPRAAPGRRGGGPVGEWLGWGEAEAGGSPRV